MEKRNVFLISIFSLNEEKIFLIFRNKRRRNLVIFRGYGFYLARGKEEGREDLLRIDYQNDEIGDGERGGRRRSFVAVY